MPEFLPDLPIDRILAALNRAPGSETRSGKFESPESSAALTANAFGWFLDRAAALPPLPGVPAGQPRAVELATEMRFPWSGGRHPWLDVGIETPTTLVGVKAVRYEPFRPKRQSDFADVYDRPVWGERMGGHTRLGHAIIEGAAEFAALDAVQLIKASYGLWNQSQKRARGAALVYLYAEPAVWASGKPVDPARIVLHRREIARFAAAVRGDAVVFVALRWADLLDAWEGQPDLKSHVAAIRARFGGLGDGTVG